MASLAALFPIAWLVFLSLGPDKDDYLHPGRIFLVGMSAGAIHVGHLAYNGAGLTKQPPAVALMGAPLYWPDLDQAANAPWVSYLLGHAINPLTESLADVPFAAQEAMSVTPLVAAARKVVLVR